MQLWATANIWSEITSKPRELHFHKKEQQSAPICTKGSAIMSNPSPTYLPLTGRNRPARLASRPVVVIRPQRKRRSGSEGGSCRSRLDLGAL